MSAKKLSKYPKTNSTPRQHKTAKGNKDGVSGDTAYPQQSDQDGFSFEQLANKPLAERLDIFFRCHIETTFWINMLRQLGMKEIMDEFEKTGKVNMYKLDILMS
jgi:hypothetical protein